jgi:hypothetical protein
MAWDNDFPLADLVQRLVDTRLRTERIRLAQQLQRLEAHAERQGFATKELRDLRASLQPPSLPSTEAEAVDRVDQALVSPRRPAGIWRRQYLAIQTKPGSIF